MPIYEYTCRYCGEQTEIFQKINEKAKRKCPKCQKLGLKKNISSTAFHLKGTGWYVTDFKDKPKDNNQDSKTKEKPKATSQKPAKKKKKSD